MHYKFDETKENLTLSLTKQFHNFPLSHFFDVYKISKKDRYLYINQKRIKINGEIVKSVTHMLRTNDVLEIWLIKEDVDWAFANDAAKLIYQNDFVAIVHKDPGMIIHTQKDDAHCLNAMVAKLYETLRINAPIRPIHRLDEDTSGLVLYVKIPFLQPWFDDQLAMKKIHRHYYALTKGKVFADGKKFGINAKIGRDRHRSGVYRVSSSGKNALTHVEIVSHHADVSFVSCQLETGRTHQIRVHLSHMQMPIINDPVYGVYDKNYTSMCLWANALSFYDPFTHKKHTIKDYLIPQDFQPYIKRDK